jgi:hypothetical protein
MRLRITKPFNDPDYIFELKHGGFRALAYVEEGPLRRSRRPDCARFNWVIASKK